MRLMKPKNSYQQHMAEYKKRFEKLRQRYGWRNGIKMPDEYNQRAYKLKKRIDVYRQAIKRHESHKENMVQLDKLIVEFIGVSAKNSKSKRGLASSARSLFFTVGMERGIRGPYLAKYVGVSNERASEARMEFKRSLKTNIYNRELWQRWKIFIREQKGVSQAA